MTLVANCKTKDCPQKVSYTEKTIPAVQKLDIEEDRYVELTCDLGHTHIYFIKEMRAE